MQHARKLIAAITTVFFIFGYACTEPGGKESSESETSDKPSSPGSELVARGEFLLTIGGCNDCHTPKLFDQNGMHLDSSRLYSGHPAGGPLPPVNPDALNPGQWYQM